MNTNEIRFYMHNYESLKKEIKHLKEALEEYRKMNVSGIKAQAITDMPISHGAPDQEGLVFTSKTELMACTRVDYIKDLENEIDNKMRLARAIDSVILYLDYAQSEIIRLRYLETPIGRRKANWIEISHIVNYSEDYCKEIDCKIIRAIQDRYIRNIIPQSPHTRTEIA